MATSHHSIPPSGGIERFQVHIEPDWAELAGPRAETVELRTVYLDGITCSGLEASDANSVLEAVSRGATTSSDIEGDGCAHGGMPGGAPMSGFGA